MTDEEEDIEEEEEEEEEEVQESLACEAGCPEKEWLKARLEALYKAKNQGNPKGILYVYGVATAEGKPGCKNRYTLEDYLFCQAYTKGGSKQFLVQGIACVCAGPDVSEAEYKSLVAECGGSVAHIKVGGGELVYGEKAKHIIPVDKNGGVNEKQKPAVERVYPFRDQGGSSVPVVLSNRNIRNDGNTCWRSAVLQMFAHSPALRDATGEDSTKALLGEIVAKGHGQVQTTGWWNNFIGTFSDFSKFASGRQEDAGEFLLPLLEVCFKKSEFLAVTTKIRCERCGTEWVSDQGETTPLMNLSIDPDFSRNGNTNLTDYMKTYFRFESVVLDQCQNVNCSPGSAKKKQNVPTQYPKQLFIQLSRFFKRGGKIKHQIRVPPTFSTRKIVDSPGGPHFDYQLRSAVVHYGDSVREGHYYTYVREQGGAWWVYDDGGFVVGKQVGDKTVERDMEMGGYLFHYERTGQDDSPPSRSKSPSRAPGRRSRSPSSARKPSPEKGKSPSSARKPSPEKGLERKSLFSRRSRSKSPSPSTKRPRTVIPVVAVVFLEKKADNENRKRVRACVESRFGGVYMQEMGEGLLSHYLPESEQLPPEKIFRRKTLFMVQDVQSLLRNISDDLGPDARLTVLEGILGLGLADESKGLRASLVPAKHGAYSDFPPAYYIGVWDTPVDGRSRLEYVGRLTRYLAHDPGYKDPGPVPAQAKKLQWGCPTCTFLNIPDDSNCKMCGGGRSTEAYATTRGECRRCGRIPRRWTRCPRPPRGRRSLRVPAEGRGPAPRPACGPRCGEG